MILVLTLTAMFSKSAAAKQFFHERTDGTKFIHEGPDAKQNLYFFMSGNCCKRRFIVLIQGLLQSNSFMKEVLQSTSIHS